MQPTVRCLSESLQVPEDSFCSQEANLPGIKGMGGKEEGWKVSAADRSWIELCAQSLRRVDDHLTTHSDKLAWQLYSFL